MNLSQPFLRRPVGTSLLALGLFLSGLVATISIQFDLNRKVDAAPHDVQAAINGAASDLPINLPNQPTYRKVNPADAPIMILALTSETLPQSQIFEFADSILGQKLSQVDGVSQATISGAEKSAVRVQVNPGALAAANISLEDVRSTLSQVNVNLPLGSFNDDQVSQTIVINGQMADAQPYQQLILRQTNNTPVRLEAFGRAQIGVENNRLAGWAGTNRAVLVIVQKQAGANVIATVDRIRALLPQLERWMPAGANLQVLSDRTRTIRASVNDVQFSLLLSIALVVMVVFLFLRRFWPTLIANVTVPLSLSGTVALMWLLGYSLDNLSLMAITISVGFVVDDAIVVIENIHRFLEQGDPPRRAALKGARQIGFTVVSMSLSLIAVFIPLLFMSGLIGRLFHEFAVTVSLAILVSGVISLTLTPMLCSRFLRAEHQRIPTGFRPKAQGCEERATLGMTGKNATTPTGLRPDRTGPCPNPVGVEDRYQWLLGYYEAGLTWVLRHQRFTLVVTLLTMVATVWLYTVVPKGFFPQQDTGVIMGATEASQDISFAAMLAMLVTGYDLSLVSFIGIILLMGIVKKNAIMMVDFALEAERERRLSPESIYQACVIRFRPIMMTTMAALLGALPLAIGLGTGSELRRPLGIAVVGGLMVSQVLTLYTTPVVFLYLDGFAARLRKWRVTNAAAELFAEEATL